jgi:peptidoglycan L-alanyl-D-glutamate endopeptidase CwlK
MSARLFETDILFFQRILAVAGFYTGALNGKWSAAVDTAQDAFFAKSDQIKQKMGAFDQRSESVIITLLPEAQAKARQFLKAVAGMPLTYRLLSGTRTYAEQDALAKKKPKVTNAKGGQSNHNFGIAWDVGIFENGKYYEGNSKKEDKAYVDLGALIKASLQGIEWGGDWTSFVDKPHYQLVTGKSVKEVRQLFEKGKRYVPT